MNIYLASDHAGYKDKDALKVYLEKENQNGHIYKVIDCGDFEAGNSDDDYTDFMHKAMKLLTADLNVDVESRAIIFGGSGQGEAMVANRYKGVRATVYYGYDMSIIKVGREHNDANVLSIGGRYVSMEETIEAVNTFLDTPYSHLDRHVRRVEKIEIVC